MAFALESLLVWIPGVLWRYRFSSWEMLKTIFSAVRDLVWLPFGRAVRIHHFDEYSFYGGGEPDFIRKERRSFVMRDLRPHPSDGQNFVFITPQGLKIDLRLNDDDVLAKFNAPLSKILEEHNLEWTRDRVRFETNLANDLRSKVIFKTKNRECFICFFFFLKRIQIYRKMILTNKFLMDPFWKNERDCLQE